MPQTTELSTYEEFLASIAHGKRPGRVTTEDNYASELGSGKRAPFPIFWENPKYPLNGLDYYLDTNNHITRKWARDTNGVYPVNIQQWYGTTNAYENPARSIGNMTLRSHPFGSTGAASTNYATSHWIPFHVTGALSSQTVDLTVGTAAAGDQYEAMVLACGVLDPADNAASVAHLLQWEDDDATAPAAGSEYLFNYVHDITNTWGFGSTTQNLAPHTMWGLGNDAQGLQIEWTSVGGTGSENVWISGIKRIH